MKYSKKIGQNYYQQLDNVQEIRDNNKSLNINTMSIDNIDFTMNIEAHQILNKRLGIVITNEGVQFRHGDYNMFWC